MMRIGRNGQEKIYLPVVGVFSALIAMVKATKEPANRTISRQCLTELEATSQQMAATTIRLSCRAWMNSSSHWKMHNVMQSRARCHKLQLLYYFLRLMYVKVLG